MTLQAGDEDTLVRMRKVLPPEWSECDSGPEAMRFTITRLGQDQYELLREGDPAYNDSSDRVFQQFDWLVRNHVAATAESHVFVHAGTVAFGDRAIIIPGASFSGKTSLVRELVAHGASYYSDEYAVLDDDGLVHPYVKTVDVRSDDARSKQRLTHGEAVPGSTAGTEPIPVGLILITHYRTGATWAPTELSPAQAVIETLPHVFSAHSRPGQVLAALRSAAQPAAALKGDRGDAAAVADELLELVQASTA
jgi:hypothetical protein